MALGRRAGLVFVLLLTACSKPGRSPQGDAGQAATSQAQTLEPAALAPVFSALGSEGAVPTRVAIQLARPVVKPEVVGQPVAEGTRLAVTPPVEGTHEVVVADATGASSRRTFEVRVRPY
jgi:hypothetical protein